jgi:hypothetical protein
MTMSQLSKARLERMHQVLSAYVERNEMPGLVALVSHHDDVHVEPFGTLAFGRLRHNGIHRSCGGNDRHPLHATHDGFAGTT